MRPTNFPLQWPVGWRRTVANSRVSARFGKSRDYNSRSKVELTIHDGVKRVLQELERMGVRSDDVIISTNVETRRDGLPRSDRSAPQDTGVAVYWRHKASDKVMAVDMYDRVADNLAAAAATMDAMRAIERHGGAAILDRVFTGFLALPAPIAAGLSKPWREVLEYGNSPASEAEITQHYRILAATAHPDRGGSHAAMAELNKAREDAMKEIQS